MKVYIFITLMFLSIAHPAMAAVNNTCRTDSQLGLASFYSAALQGNRTYSGERYDMKAMTAAHRTLPMGSMLAVTDRRTGRSVIVRVNDRGPFVRNRLIDLSSAAAEALRIKRRGITKVELRVLCPDELIMVHPKPKPQLRASSL